MINRSKGLEVEGAKSLAEPGSLCVLITGPTIDIVTNGVLELLEKHPDASFMTPIRAADGSWTTFGRVPQ